MKIAVSERLKEYMSQHDLKQVDILNKCEPYCKKYNVNISKSKLSHYVNGSFEPKQDMLFVLAKALNVSEAWLMGYDVPAIQSLDESAAIVLADAAMDPELIEYTRKIQMLPKEKRTKVYGYIDALSE